MMSGVILLSLSLILAANDYAGTGPVRAKPASAAACPALLVERAMPAKETDLSFGEMILDGAFAFAGNVISYIAVDKNGGKKLHLLDTSKRDSEQKVVELPGTPERVVVADEKTFLVLVLKHQPNLTELGVLVDAKSGDALGAAGITRPHFRWGDSSADSLIVKDRTLFFFHEDFGNDTTVQGFKVGATPENGGAPTFTQMDVSLKIPADSRFVGFTNGVFVEKNENFLIGRDLKGKSIWKIPIMASRRIAAIEIFGEELYVLTYAESQYDETLQLAVYSLKSNKILRTLPGSDGKRTLVNFQLHPENGFVSLYYNDRTLRIRRLDHLPWVLPGERSVPALSLPQCTHCSHS
ncbi:MAG: hypothetical protein HY075_13535 [Deltaproteobacteria bacterium]|nr:hypothetical protein [Deltaproteobacteria bacterium]